MARFHEITENHSRDTRKAEQTTSGSEPQETPALIDMPLEKLREYRSNTGNPKHIKGWPFNAQEGDESGQIAERFRRRPPETLRMTSMTLAGRPAACRGGGTGYPIVTDHGRAPSPARRPARRMTTGDRDRHTPPNALVIKTF
jgi:hypothetical protein